LKKYLIYLIFFAFFLTNCNKDPGFSSIPEISLKNMSYFEEGTVQHIKLEINYKDGDGDLGLEPTDTSGIYAPKNVKGRPSNIHFYNFIVTYLFKNDDGTYKTCNLIMNCSSDTILSSTVNTANLRFPVLNSVTKKQPISGVLTNDINSPALKKVFSGNTIKLQIYIFDRALNQSNVITTDSLRF
jgi:hypothetical protein